MIAGALFSWLSYALSSRIRGKKRGEGAPISGGGAGKFAILRIHNGLTIPSLSEAEGILYEFMESPVEMAGNQIHKLISDFVGETYWEKLFELLLWYGFLGIRREKDEISYIYNMRYDMRRLIGVVRKTGFKETRFYINPAFWKALEVQH